MPFLHFVAPLTHAGLHDLGNLKTVMGYPFMFEIMYNKMHKLVKISGTV